MSILLKRMSEESLSKLRDIYENPPDLDENQIKNQKEFIHVIIDSLKVERPSKVYKDLTEQDYEDIALVAVMNSLNMPMIKTIDDPSLCENCGKCCTETEIILLLNREYNNLKRTIRDLNSKVSVHPSENGHYAINSMPCVFYDSENKRCKIYSRRPIVCRNYPISDQKIDGKMSRMLVTLADCGYSIKLVSLIALKLFDQCTS